MRKLPFARGREERRQGEREGGKENILWDGPLREEFAIAATCGY